ncbi:MAG: endolytic transglycosylase MltG [Bacteroidetes bacterium]|nr:MAG: endolytic transglycosylase MltG [Bacteroidota bacterium]
MEIHHSEFTTDVNYRVPLWVRLMRWSMMLLGAFVLGGATTGILIWQLTGPPSHFPVNEPIEIAEGTSARDIALQLKEQGVVKSDLALYSILILLHDPTAIKASTYKFKQPQNAFAIASRLIAGEFGIDLIRFVHYEGERNELLAERAAEVLLDFDVEEFLRLTKDKEGRMFPDTYLIPESYTAKELVTLLEDTFNARIEPLRPAIRESNYTEDEVIIIASLIEREANTRESKRMVAGIINNRLNEGMPLQLDASIEYSLSTPLNELAPGELAAELKATDTPYNTYLNTGLPPTPIGNPGLTSIEAVLRPIESNYFFYLTGRDGNFYYAETGAEHNRNVANYLR